MAKMMDRCAVILVSHSPNLIRFNCDKVLVLNKGQTQFIGPASQGIDEYTDFMMRQRLPENNGAVKESKLDPRVQLKSFNVLDRDYHEITEVAAGETVVLEC